MREVLARCERSIYGVNQLRRRVGVFERLRSPAYLDGIRNLIGTNFVRIFIDICCAGKI